VLLPSLFYSTVFYSCLFYSLMFYSLVFYSFMFYSPLFYSPLFYSPMFYSPMCYYPPVLLPPVLPPAPRYYSVRPTESQSHRRRSVYWALHRNEMTVAIKQLSVQLMHCCLLLVLDCDCFTTVLSVCCCDALEVGTNEYFCGYVMSHKAN